MSSLLHSSLEAGTVPGAFCFRSFPLGYLPISYPFQTAFGILWIATFYMPGALRIFFPQSISPFNFVYGIYWPEKSSMLSNVFDKILVYFL